MKRKILTLITIISLVSLTMFGLGGINLFRRLKTVKADTLPTISIDVDNVCVYDTYATVWIDVKNRPSWRTGIKVYYKTVNGSAIGSTTEGAGDYDKEKDGSYIEIDKTSQIVIKINNKDPYGITMSDGTECYRSFFVELYKVDGSATIDSNNNKVEVSLDSDYKFASKKASDGLQTLEGLEGVVTAEYLCKKSTYMNGVDNCWYHGIKITLDAKTKYLYSKNLGHYYVSGGAYLSSWDTNFQYMGFNIGGVKEDGSTYDGIRYRACGPHFFGLDKHLDLTVPETMKLWGSRNSDTYYSADRISYTNGQTINWEDLGDSSKRDGTTSISNSSFWKMDDGIYKNFYMMGKNEGSYGRYLCDAKIMYAYIDDTNPDIVTYAIDRDYTDNAKIYVSIRFSEPVQLSGTTKPSYITTVGGKSTQKVTFEYAYGAGTDTLVFSVNLNSITYDILIDEFSVYDFANCKNIVDMSNRRNAFSNYSYKEADKRYVPTIYPGKNDDRLEIEIDNRTPVISESNIAQINSVKKSDKVSITLSNIDKDKAHVYYSWSNDCTNAINITRLDDYTKEAKMNSSYKVSISSDGLTGVRFLWVKAVSPLNKTCSILCGPFYFDSSVDQISNITFVDDDAGVSSKEKIITFDVDYSDSFITAQPLSYIDLVYSHESNWLAGSTYYYNKAEATIGKNRFIDLSKPNTHIHNMGTEEKPSQYEVIESVTANVFEFDMQTINEESSVSKSTFYKKENNVAVTKTYNKKIRYKITVGYKDLGIEEGKFDKIYLGLSLEDSLGNITTVPNVYHSSLLCRFDSRDVIGLETYYKFINSRQIIKDDDLQIYSSKNAKIYFKLATPVNSYVLYVKKAGTENEYLSTEEIDELFDVKFENGVDFTISAKDALGIDGYYTIFVETKDGTDVKFTEDFSFYLVSDELDNNTRNIKSIESNKLFINKVYQISNEISYYYKDIDGVVTAIKYNDKQKLSFSSYEKASEYLTMLEYEDLYLLEIGSSDIASNINNNTNGYIKAVGETQDAAMGQYWIRYKRSTWSVKNVGTEQWCYYFVGYSTESINLDNLPVNLKNAISNVVENLMEDYGFVFYLTSQEGLKNGVPYLDDTQIRLNDITITESLSKSPYKKAFTYYGDKEIYDTTLVYNDEEYIISSTHVFEVSDYTLVYIKKYGNNDYQKVDISEGKALKTIVTFSGLYSILEVDENGAREFTCYVDADAPTVKIEVTSVDSNGNDKTIKLTTDSTTSQYKYNAKTFVLSGIDQEIDEYAYCAVFKVSGSKLLGVYSKEDLLKNNVVLEEGRYYVEVYDRSGNNYTITLTLNATEMNAYYKVADDGTKFTVKVDNRGKDDIYRYEITYNGKLQISEFTDSISFKDSGTYSIYIEDWYGNVYSEEIDFVRSSPEVTFRVNTGNGYQTYVEGKSEYFAIAMSDNGVYNITTSKEFQMRIQKSPEVVVEVVIGGTKFKVSESSVYSTYELEKFYECTFKVYYKDYPEIYGLYCLMIDNEAPKIDVSYLQGVYVEQERAEVDDIVAAGIGVKAGTEITPSSIYYYEKDNLERTILNNSKISSKNISLNITDASEITNVKIIYNEIEIYNGNNLDELPSLNKYGKFVITATDALNNTNMFTFTNEYQSEINCLVDGMAKELPVSSSEYFDLNYDYTNIFYGNSSLELGLEEDCTLVLKLESDSFTLFYMFTYEEGVLYSSKFIVTISDTPQYDDFGNIISTTTLYADLVNDKKLFDYEIFTQNGYKYNTYYSIYTLEDDGVDLLIKNDSSNKITLKICSSTYENEIYDINAKIYFVEEKEPVYIRTILSKAKTDITILNGYGEVETNQDEKLVYTNGELSIDRDKLDRNLVTKIRIGYSKTNSFSNFQTVYELGELSEFLMLEDGFYRIEITNVYGNINTYNICLSNELLIVTTILYDDLKEIVYSGAYKELEYYSNKTITLDIYSDYAEVEIYKDDKKYSINLVDKNGYLSFTLEVPGYYTADITDKFGNTTSRKLIIDKQTLRLSDDMLYGFNEKALRKSEYYTNTLISINSDELAKSNFKLIELYKDSQYIRTIYDDISEKRISYSNDTLIDAIGIDGDGKYEVVFRDSYGNKIIQEINYKKAPTIAVSRLTLTGEKDDEYDINDIVLNSIYSNNYITIRINSMKYSLIDNDVPLKVGSNNIYRIEFTTDTLQTTTITHKIYYLDDYGNEYNFECTLLRQDISFDSLQEETLVFEEQIFTKKPIQITFKDEYYCKYSIDGSETKYDYISGDRLLVDGKYAFTLSDKAGNEEYYIITKDTSVAYSFNREKTKGIIVDNEIILNDNVELKTTSSDGVQIVNAFLNGEEIAEVPNKFSETGKWEIVLKDKLDNKSLFTFYIISHVVNSFSYTTPENIVITEITRDTGEGIKISYVSKVYNDNKSFDMTLDGKYEVKLLSQITGETTTFDFEISTALPEAVLDGVENGQVTPNNIKLLNTKEGDVIYVYKDGIFSEKHVCTSDGDTVEIEEQGTYHIIVKNIQGNTVEYNFIRKYMPNNAGNALIIVLLVGLSSALFVAILYRNKSRVDK